MGGRVAELNPGGLTSGPTLLSSKHVILLFSFNLKAIFFELFYADVEKEVFTERRKKQKGDMEHIFHKWLLIQLCGQAYGQSALADLVKEFAILEVTRKGQQ